MTISARETLDYKRIRKLFAARESIDPEKYVRLFVRLQIDGSLDPQQVCADMILTCANGTLSSLPWAAQDVSPLILDLADVGDKYHAEIAYPIEMFGDELNIPQLLTVAWLPAEYSDTKHIWLDDIQLPLSMLATAPGPSVGMAGFLQWRLSGAAPLLSAILKPRVGGDLHGIKQAVREAFDGGVDGIVDDEGLVDPAGDMKFERRVPELCELVQKLSGARNRYCYYFVNITAPLRISERLVEIAHSCGASGVIANPFAMGFAAFEYLAQLCRDRDMCLIDCSIGSALICLPTGHSGTSISLLSKLARLVGADGSHSGSEGEHWYTPDTLRRVISSLTAPLGVIKPTIPVIAGNVNVGNVWRKINQFGADCMVNAGTGIWSHPAGPQNGAFAIRKLLDSVPADLSPDDAHVAIRRLYKRERAVEQGIDNWGYIPVVGDREHE